MGVRSSLEAACKAKEVCGSWFWKGNEAQKYGIHLLMCTVVRLSLKYSHYNIPVGSNNCNGTAFGLWTQE